MEQGKEKAEKIARLAAIELTDEQLDAMGAHLGRMVAFVESLKEVDVRGVEPLTQPHGNISLFRADEPARSFDPEIALMNAPAREGNLFEVPRVIEL